MPPSHILLTQPPDILYSLRSLQARSDSTPSIPTVAIVFAIIGAIFLLCFCCSCCCRRQPRHSCQQKWQSSPTTSSPVDHRLERSNCNDIQNSPSTERMTNPSHALDSPPEYAFVPVPPPAYTPERRSQPRTSMHVYSHELEGHNAPRTIGGGGGLAAAS